MAANQQPYGVSSRFDGYYNLKQALEYSVNADARTIYVFEDVTEANADTVIKAIHEFERLDDEAEIAIHVSTFGGCVYSMIKIYDAIRACGCPMKTVSSGMVMSAGVLIAMSGDVGNRYSYENTQFMYHKGSFEVDGEHNNAVKTVQHYEHLQNRVLKLIAQRSKKKEKFWKTLEDGGIDAFLTAQRAKSYGIIDHIIQSTNS